MDLVEGIGVLAVAGRLGEGATTGRGFVEGPRVGELVGRLGRGCRDDEGAKRMLSSASGLWGRAGSKEPPIV